MTANGLLCRGCPLSLSNTTAKTTDKKYDVFTVVPEKDLYQGLVKVFRMASTLATFFSWSKMKGMLVNMNNENMDINFMMENMLFPTIIKSGEKVIVRLLEKEDEMLLGDYFEGLSESTRSFFGPHAFNRETASEICSGINNTGIPRVIASLQENNRQVIIAYTILMMSVRESDKIRYLQYDIPLNDEMDCTIAPSVADGYQNMGLGNIIMNHVIDMVRKSGKKRIVLWEGVQKRNDRAIHFYKKFGFKQVMELDQSIDMVLEL